MILFPFIFSRIFSDFSQTKERPSFKQLVEQLTQVAKTWKKVDSDDDEKSEEEHRERTGENAEAAYKSIPDDTYMTTPQFIEGSKSEPVELVVKKKKKKSSVRIQSI